MIRWIQNHQWQSSITLAAFSLCVFGGIDALSAGLMSLLVALANAVAVLLAREFSWLSILLILTSPALAITLNVHAGASGAIALLALALISALAIRCNGMRRWPVLRLQASHYFGSQYLIP
jgi:hypothetical protein